MTDTVNESPAQAEPVDPPAPVTLAQVQDLLRDTINPLALDVNRVAQVCRILNTRGPRDRTAIELIEAVLAPAPEYTDAINSLAELKAAVRALGPLVEVTVEWDSQLRFLTVVRAQNGFNGPLTGFSLVDGTPGFKQLKLALEMLKAPADKIEAFLRQPIPTPESGVARRTLMS